MSIVGNIFVLKDYFSLATILIQEIIDTIPFSIIIYLLAKLTTSLIFGFNKSNKDKIYKITKKIKENSNMIQRLKKRLERNFKIENIENINYDVFNNNLIYQETAKVKKLGSIKR